MFTVYVITETNHLANAKTAATNPKTHAEKLQVF
jgi:hypothetical protein